MTIKPPFPWFGGKSQVAHVVWERFGNVPNYVEPFFGSGAVLFARPTPPKIETINDKDGYVANFWRAVQKDPEQVAYYADWPVNENDLHARHIWLVNQKDTLQSLLEGDPDFYDPKIAGWWVWGMAIWIGGGFCSGEGSWQVVDGQLVHLGNAGQGVNRRLVHLGNAGQGVNRRRVHLSNAGQGVNRKRVHLSNAGQGVNRKRVELTEYFNEISERLRNVRVCSGDWSRVCGPSPTFLNGLTGVFLDPPYSKEANRDNNIYTVDDLSVAHAVREWCIENGDNPLMRIALCGYEGEHNMPSSWDCVAWKARGGYGSQSDKAGRDNCHRERIWFSPHCINNELFVAC